MGFLRWFILTTLALLFAVASAQEVDLREQSLIRVYISNAPGLGHQSASVAVIRRLRQLGFEGTFEVVYNDGIEGKLSTLLPGFVIGNRQWQDLAHLKIRMIAESEFLRIPKMPQVDLSISGADDNRLNMNPVKMHAKNYLLLEPQGWGDSLLFQEGRSEAKVIPGLRDLGFLYEIHDSESVLKNEFMQMKASPEFVDKVAGLEALLSRPAVMGSIYGVGLIPNMPEKIKIWVQGLQMAERSQKFTMPVVLPIISALNDFEMRTLKWELGLLEAAQDPKKAKKIILLDIKDPSLPAVRDSLRAGDVLLVHTGRLPQSVFEILFKRSTLPVLVAGKNAMNLAQSLGKSYINTVNDYGFKFTGQDARSERTIQQASEVFFESRTQDIYIRRLSKFIQESLDPHSEIRGYFAKLGPNGRDKVAEALDFLNQELDARGARSCGRIFIF